MNNYHYTIEQWVRPSLMQIKPYATARDEFKGRASVYLDANENSQGSPAGDGLNRYPDPFQLKLKEKISVIKGVPVPHIFLGNGSDEAIDLLYRIFCDPGLHNVIICPPSYGMYSVSAAIHNVEIRNANLDPAFDLDLEGIEKKIDMHTRLIFVCSPNNPTGNSMSRARVEWLLKNFKGIVVVDEAYINYSRYTSFIADLTDYENLVVLQTFSKAWGMAALRLGLAFSSQGVIEWMHKIKPPYNINELTQRAALAALDEIDTVNNWTRETVEQRTQLAEKLKLLPQVITVYPSDANFLLVKFSESTRIFKGLLQRGIVVRDRSRAENCENCLRITVGNADENNSLVKAITELE